MYNAAIAAIGLASLATASPFRRWEVGQEVQTTSGLIKGHTSEWPKGAEVSEYLGIPFAQPPLGELRFAAPKPYISNNTFDAANFAMDCTVNTDMAPGGSGPPSPELQRYTEGMGGGSPPHKYGEDCLGLNIWTKPQVGEKKKAVMVWIYGGGFSTGSANAPYYNAARLAADQDVVGVSFNYRINIFGFPSGAAAPDANPGLLDQRLAVEWVRDNIEKFGGDPERIIIFGESAGGASVDYYAYAWAEDPIVTGFIAESGTASLGGGSPGSPEAAPWWNVSQALGCGGFDAGKEKSLDCMRTKDAQEIIRYVGKMNGGSTMTPFGPSADEKVVFADFKARAAAGKIAKKPLLVGLCDYEMGILKGLGGMLPMPGSGTALPASSSNDSSNPLTALTGALGGGADPIAIASDSFANCPAADAADARLKNGIPAWRYRYMGVWDNLSIAPGSGAYHSSEIPLVFGTSETGSNKPKNVPEESKLEEYMMKAWTTFAKDPERGLLSMDWPIYDPNKPTLNRLGYNNQSATNFATGNQYDGICGVMSNLPKLPGGRK